MSVLAELIYPIFISCFNILIFSNNLDEFIQLKTIVK